VGIWYRGEERWEWTIVGNGYVSNDHPTAGCGMCHSRRAPEGGREDIVLVCVYVVGVIE
jgi:hypothetical protein